MSHSVVFVIVKRPDVGVDGELPTEEARELSSALLDALVEEPLAPFNENTNVEPYKERCYCVDTIARREANEAAVKECGGPEEARAIFWNRDDVRELDKQQRVMRNNAGNRKFTKEENKAYSEMEEKKNVLWREYFRDKFDAAVTKHHDAHPTKDKPDADCDECKGTGERETTYNPDSKWDWYQVGGRWSGIFAEVSTSLMRAVVGDDVRLVSDLAACTEENEIIPFSVLEPDGTWHEKGDMGWWGMVSNEKERGTWEEEVRTLYKKYDASYLCIAVDVHI